MTDFRENDVAKLQGTVLRVNDDHTAAYLDVIGKRYWINVDDLELVERPGPRLEELPDGTVVRPTHIERAAPWIKQDIRVIRINPIPNGEHLISSWEHPFEVIGACPGTPAWDLFMRGNAGWDADKAPDTEWWRSE
jgi:hypothetical protein